MVLFFRVSLPLKHYLSTSFSLWYCRRLYTCNAPEKKVKVDPEVGTLFSGTDLKTRIYKRKLS